MSGGSVTFRASSPGYRELLRRLGQTAELGREAVGIEINQLLRDHFSALHNRRHRSGGSGFYAKAADSVFHRLAAEGVYVGTRQQGLRQRYHGGPIRPRRSRYLTIPVNPIAYGKRARDSSLGDLFIIRSASGVLLLGKSKGEQFIPFFVLLRGVNQNADPSVLPTEQEIGTRSRAALRRTVNQIRN